ncbi:MAG: dehydrogenase E1 component subunit alpha/beta [Planctomycetes bacterium]|nr:dehydrogenase E1 component subunit alpha/beta [Planctomycetota bacterium]
MKLANGTDTIKNLRNEGDAFDRGDVTGADLLAVYRMMRVSRRLDEKMLILLKQGKGFFHIGCSGHEAAQLAAAEASERGKDYYYPYYRGQSIALGVGMEPRDVLRCFLSRENDPNSGGRQMPQHYGHKDLRIVSQSSPTGTQYLQAVGAAMASRKAGTDEVVLVTSGEGTTSQGDFHEALNWSSREKLPVIFLVENNRFAISVPVHEQTSGDSVFEMIKGYPGLHRVSVDGTDYLASLDAMREAYNVARRGDGPSLVEANVVRLLPHSSSDDHRKYRSEEDIAKDLERDPIRRLGAFLVRNKIADEDELEEIRKEVLAEIDEIALEMEQEQMPDPSTVRDHLFCEGENSPVGFSETPENAGASIVLVDAINHCLDEEMVHNDKMLVFGQDVAHGKGGVFTATRGLTAKFGVERCFNSPLAEASIVGVAIGLATRGFKPVAEIQFGDYCWTAMMQIRNELATMRYRSNEAWSCPVVIRIPVGGYIHGGLCHSQNIEGFFAHLPGIHICLPSNAADAKGLLRTAIRCDDPVLFLEHKGLYRAGAAQRPEPGADYRLPFGVGKIVHEGTDATVVTWGMIVHKTMNVVRELEKEGVSVEVIDLRTIVPWDRELVLESVKKTGRALVAHEDTITQGFGAEIAATIASEGFELLDAPVRRLGALDLPVPYASTLEAVMLPQDADIANAIRSLVSF